MKADELRAETDKLQEKIKIEVDKFISNVGSCDISIDTELVYQENFDKNKRLVRSDVKVHVTI